MKINILCHFDLLRAKNLPNVTIQMADGLANRGNIVEIVVPYVFRKDNIKIKNVYDFYGVKKTFKIKILKTILLKNSYKKNILIVLVLSHLFKAVKLFFINGFSKKKDKMILISTLSFILIPYIIILKKLANFSNIKIIPWEHEFHKRKGEIWVYKNCDGLLVTNSAIKNDLINEFDISPKKIFITYNPISNSRIKSSLHKTEIRKELNIETNKEIIVYTGKLGVNIKEVLYIIEAASLLPQYLFILTGGKPEVVKYFKDFFKKKEIKNVQLTGFLYKYDDIKYYQLAADVLIAYYSKYDLDVRYNLPAKIGEYLTSKNPIVTVDHPATRDILNKDNVYFVEPDDPTALASGIKSLIENKELANHLSQNAYKDAESITYDKMAIKICDFLHKI